MKFITGQDRNQILIFASPSEAFIDMDKEVRLNDFATKILSFISALISNLLSNFKVVFGLKTDFTESF